MKNERDLVEELQDRETEIWEIIQTTFTKADIALVNELIVINLELEQLSNL